MPDPLLLLQVFNMLLILSQPLCTSCCRFRVNLLTFTQLCQLMVRLFMDLKRMPRRALLFGDLGTESSRRAFKHGLHAAAYLVWDVQVILLIDGCYRLWCGPSLHKGLLWRCGCLMSLIRLGRACRLRWTSAWLWQRSDSSLLLCLSS